MKLGLAFDLRNPPSWSVPLPRRYGRALEVCQEADRLGVGGLWFSEHHRFDDDYLPQPLTFAAAVAACTSSATIGTCVLQPALRQPAQLAEEVAVVDNLSDGRLELGVGAGYRLPEFELFGVDASQRYRRTEDVLVEMRRLWAEAVTPVPVRGDVPLWGGFYGPRGAALAGRLDMGLLYLSRRRFGEYSAAHKAAGHADGDARVAGLLPFVVADDPDSVWPRISRHVAYQVDSYARHEAEGTGLPSPPPVDIQALRRPRGDEETHRFFVFTPEEAIRYLSERTAGLPTRHAIVWADIAAMPDDIVERHVQLVCANVQPRLEAAASTIGAS